MPGWIKDVQGYTTILDAAGNPLPRRKTLQMSTGLVATDNGTDTVVISTGGGASGSDDITNDSTVSGVTVSDALETLEAGQGGLLQYFDTSRSPVALYQGSRTDQSGNGFDLDTVLGPVGETEIMPGRQAIRITDGSSARMSAPEATLQITGDMTAMAIVRFESAPNGVDGIVCYNGTSSSAEAQNALYLCQVGDHGTFPRSLRFFWENGSGADNDYSNATGLQVPAFGNVMFLAWVRTSDVAQMYLNGIPLGDPSPTQNTPTGGTLGILQVGGVNTGLNAPTSFDLFSLQIIAATSTDAQIKTAYNASMGPAFGTIA